jgi:hypothetical protein
VSSNDHGGGKRRLVGMPQNVPETTASESKCCRWHCLEDWLLKTPTGGLAPTCKEKSGASSSLRQARHLLELQNDPQGNYDVFDVTAAGSLVECTGNVAPRFTLSAFARQMNLYKLADVGERGQGHYRWDFQRPGKRRLVNLSSL